MAKPTRNKKHRMQCRWCGNIMTHKDPCCPEHTKALESQSFKLCTVCDKYFDTKEELTGHSHREAA